MNTIPHSQNDLNLEPVAKAERCDQCDAKDETLTEKLCESCTVLNANLETYETLGYHVARAFDGLAQNDPRPIDSFEFGVHRAVDEMTDEMKLSRPYRKPVVEAYDARPDLWLDAAGLLACAFLRVCSPDQLEVLSAQFHRVALEEIARLARPAGDTVPVVGGSS